MKKLKKFFSAIKLIVRKPALLNLVLNDEDVNRQQVIAKYNLADGLLAVDILDLLPNLHETIDPFCSLDGGSPPLDIALLKGLARRKKDCEYFEIGTWRGESVANVAVVAKHCITLNLPDDEMLKTGMSKAYVDSHRFFSKNIINVTHLQHDSRTFDFSSLNKKFDLIFIDGDHHYESVKLDTQHAFPLLKDESSIIVWHDYQKTPAADIRWDVLRGILDGTPAEKQHDLYHVSNTLCVIYTTQAIASKHLQPYEAPDKYFSMEITANKV